ncbi:MAG TPA: SPW repeat protein [Chthoniobacteraceae bacterium]|jgi:hypothetical protein
MQFLTPRIHGILDYITGALLLASPWLFGFADDRHARGIALVAGGALVFLSLITDYEPGVLRFVPFPIHRSLDFLLGIMVGGAPIHFGVTGAPMAVFMVAGAMEIGGALLTRSSSNQAGHPIVPGA